MKTLVICMVAGLMAGLIVWLLSGRQRPGPSLLEGVPVAERAVRSSAPPASPLTTRTSDDATGRPRAPTREETSRQLQLEIERALVSLDDEARDRAYTQLLPALIAIDSAAVERVIERCPAGPVRAQLLRYTALAWSAANLHGAINWVGAMKDDDERLVAASEVVSQVAQSDPARAIEVADRFGIGRRDGRVERIAQVWAAEDLSAALQWVQAQPAGAERDQLLTRIVIVQAESVPAGAARTALGGIAPGPLQDEAVVTVVHRWSVQDPDGAAAWVQGLPRGHVREIAEADLAQSAQQRGLADSDMPGLYPTP